MKKHKPSQQRKQVNPAIRSGSSHQWTVLQGIVDALTPSLGSDLVSNLNSIIRARDMDAYLSLSSEWGLQSKNPLVSSISTKCAELLVVSVMRKYTPDGDNPEHERKAFASVRDTDQVCGAYTKFRNQRRDLPPSPLMKRVREVAKKILGVLPNDIQTHIDCRHGPGSSTSLAKKNSSSYFKYDDWPYRCATRATPYLRDLISCDERWMSYLEDSYRERFEIPKYCILHWSQFWETVIVRDDYNKVTSVPKDVTKRRPIAIEPTGNILLQLGVDGFIRRSLKKWGIDLDDQSLNQRLAHRGSVMTGPLTPATVDLANASDTVSLGVCKDILPTDWYDYLLDIRSTYGIFPDGSRIRYRKISSMGNGYTFALESLVFFCFAFAVTEKYLGGCPRGHVAVFGDDLIVPEACVQHLVRSLKVYGFSVNTEKSFLTGPVKESCGTDWINGYNVRPVFFRKPLKRLTDIYSLRNRLRRWFTLKQGIYPTALDDLFLGWIGHTPPHIGPVSDDEFDTYWHSEHPVKGMWNNWRYSFSSVSSSYKERGGCNNFFLRSLMHPLKPNYRPKHEWSDITPNGSVFFVEDRSFVRYTIVRRTVPDWCGSYSLSLPWE